MDKIGKKIRALRLEKGLSQDNLASSLGLTQSSYARLEKNDDRISINRLLHIAKILEVNAIELLHDEESKDKINYEKGNLHSQSENSQFLTLNKEIIILKDIISNLVDKLSY
jgi:transcriptional regulator with XRE-family HTH domain